MLCQHEDLYVENPTLEMLIWKDVLRRFTSEQLESTLGITDVTNADEAKRQMQSTHGQIPQERALREGVEQGNKR